MNDLFDFNQLDELMSADPEELKQVLWDLFKDFGLSFAALPAKVEAGALPDVAMEAHQLRGVASSFGLKLVSDTAKDLEFTANRGDATRSLELIQQSRDLLVESERQLRELRPAYF
jgi:hypothetical protein